MFLAHLPAAAATAERLPPAHPDGARPVLLELADGAPLALALDHHLLVLDALVALAAVEPRALHRVRRVRHEEPCNVAGTRRYSAEIKVYHNILYYTPR